LLNKKVIAIRHVLYECLGSFEEVLEKNGYEIEYLDAGVDDLKYINSNSPDILFILGAPLGVYDAKDYPFISEEIEIIKYRIHKNLPTFGICFGSQLIAKAMGTEVYFTGEKEIGWKPIEISNFGKLSSFSIFDENPFVLHWHGDTFDLPKGAQRLASTDLTPNQAFCVGENIMAIQFHPEVTLKNLERWFIGHLISIKAQEGVTVHSLRNDSIKFANRQEKVAQQFLENWLAELV
jgi:GMP synthase (glutamine-hydrolysing)